MTLTKEEVVKRIGEAEGCVWNAMAEVAAIPIVEALRQAAALLSSRSYLDGYAQAKEDAAKVCCQLRPINAGNHVLQVQRDTLDNAIRLIRALRTQGERLEERRGSRDEPTDILRRPAEGGQAERAKWGPTAEGRKMTKGKMEQAIVRAAMRWYRRALKEGYSREWATWPEAQAEWNACARYAKSKSKGKP